MLMKCSGLMAVAVLNAGLLVAQGRHGGNQPSAAHAPQVQAPRAAAPIYPTPIGLQPQFAGFSGINTGAWGNIHPYQWSGSVNNNPNPANGGRGGRHPGGGGRSGMVGLPYYPVFSSYYDTPNYYDAAGGYGQSLTYPVEDQTAQVTANLLGEQIQNLRAELQELRSERYAAAQPLPVEENLPQPSQRLVVVMRDGRRMEIQSYAVMNGALWDLSGQNSRRIPVSGIDVPASEKANEALGVSFPELSNQGAPK